MARAFLIGAGATRAQYPEAPLSDDFFKKLADVNRNLYKFMNDNLAAYIKPPLLDHNVEKVMIQAETFPTSIRTAFLEGLYEALFQLLARPTKSDENSMQAYLNGTERRNQTLFKALLLRPELTTEDFFMTLNYDLCLDQEIIKLKKALDYGLEEAGAFEGQLGRGNIHVSAGESYSIYHLHGSLNWDEWSENKVRTRLGALPPDFGEKGTSLCLMPPGQKEFNPIFRSLWYVVEQRLARAEELIIIGCSLNPDDAEVMSLVSQFIDRKGTESIKLVYLDEYEGKPALSHQSIIGDPQQHFKYGFNLEAIEFIFS